MVVLGFALMVWWKSLLWRVCEAQVGGGIRLLAKVPGRSFGLVWHLDQMRVGWLGTTSCKRWLILIVKPMIW